MDSILTEIYLNLKLLFSLKYSENKTSLLNSIQIPRGFQVLEPPVKKYTHNKLTLFTW